MSATKTHLCPMPRCPATISIRLAMCARHWYRVPLPLRTQLWAAVSPGQLDGTAPPSETYLTVLQSCLNTLHTSVAPIGTRRRHPRSHVV